MSTNPIRKPSAASESFITALAILFFASLAILFLWLDNKKFREKQKQITSESVSDKSVSFERNVKIDAPGVIYGGG